MSRTLYGCVNWNGLVGFFAKSLLTSHPLRVRELKPFSKYHISFILCRTLYGCVNWNTCWHLSRWPKIVAPFTGAWIETAIDRPCLSSVSRTLYGCVNWNYWWTWRFGTHWRRTLYGCVNWNMAWNIWRIPYYVAPFTGAWIETRRDCNSEALSLVAPFTGAWIETEALSLIYRLTAVAPFTGAWIETFDSRYKTIACQSHPLRVRELKPTEYKKSLRLKVAPFTGAWIETAT